MHVPQAEATPLCVQLKWTHQSQFAGFYVAEREGYYREVGLDVRFLEGGPATKWQERFADPECPLGVTNAYELVIARERGTAVRAIAAVAQVSPIVWFSIRGSGISDPRQFRGKRVMVVPTGRIQLLGMLDKVGMSMKDFQDGGQFSTDMQRFYDGEVDVWSGYHTNLVTKAEEDGYELTIIHPINYGVQIYDDVIYARDDLIRESPDVVEAFLRATLRGWLTAIRQPALALSDTMKYAKMSDEAHERRMFLRSIPYIHTGEVRIGWMQPSVWEEICRLTAQVGLVDRCTDPQRVYTLEFLNRIYAASAHNPESSQSNEQVMY